MPILRCLILLTLLTAVGASAQPLDVTFRYVPGPDDNFVRAFVPGEFNTWGPNHLGRISVGAVSQMTYVDSLEQWLYTTPLEIGKTYEYKIHFHYDGSGSDRAWISDPLNDRTNPSDNNNSVVTITDPMLFQPARELNSGGLIDAVSAGLFSTNGVASIQFEINGIPFDGLPYYDRTNGVFRRVLDHPIKAGSQFKLVASDSLGTEIALEIGEVQPPVTWRTPDHETFLGESTLVANITTKDGTVDPFLTVATLDVNGTESLVDVENGEVRVEAALQRGVNEILIRAVVEAEEFRSDTLRITRLDHPLSDSLATAFVSGAGNDFDISLTPVPGRTSHDYAPATWTFDSTASTVGLDGPLFHQLDGTAISGTAEGPGELYFNIELEARDGTSDFIRAAVIVGEDGTVRSMRYAETAAWINRAVVYEIFPLSFGPTEASGTPASPGRRFDEITAELDYIAKMGFTTLWFMPVFHNQFMDQLSGGYNIVDLYNVDPKLGTNEDFKALIQRAHELGLRVILDITPSHVSPVHPWVESLRELGEDSPFYEHIQTVPNAHTRGLDNRGANLAEIWQSEGGRNLYRKYDGFGDLANVNWDDDDLQARMLDVLAYWVREFDVDGWRFDVYWGPWRRYGPDRFGRPVRELMKRIKPDAWLLGEIAGTGPSTEVYYADDDHGTAVVGGIDAGYDWNFYHDGIRGMYGNLRNYDNLAHNNGFWPGPNARYFRFLENHDETRIAKVLGSNPDRVLPLAGFLLTTTGIPMIYQGQEVNFGNIGGDERRRPVSWETDRNGEFAATYQRLSHARTSFPAFATQDLITLNTSNGVYAYVRPYLDENAVVLINFAGDARTVSINPTPHVDMTTDGPVPYTHLFADSTFTDLELDGFTATLSAYETAVFITRDEVDFTVPDLPRLPFGAVYTGSEPIPSELPRRAVLHQNYPNPFNPSTIIPYSLPAGGQVTLEVFDVLGRRVAVLIDALQPGGIHELEFDARNLPSGTYVARLAAAGTVHTRVLVLTK